MSHDHQNAGVVPAMNTLENDGCEESRLLISRRHLLGVTAGFFSWAYMPKFAEAGTANDPRMLFVILRGGMDGVNTVVPHGDPNYYAMRGSIAIPQASMIKLDSFFGLHPALVNFGKMYKDGEASVIHAVAPPLRTRSHFDAQDNLETGMPNQPPTNASGWLNRLLGYLPAGNAVREGGGIQIGAAPVILRGAAPVLGWSPSTISRVPEANRDSLLRLYSKSDKQLGEVLSLGLKANEFALSVSPGAQTESVSDLLKAFRGAGRLMKVDSGPRISVLSVGGFDTHFDQGGVSGKLATLLSQVDSGLGDFKAELGAEAWKNTIVVCVTEFGRTLAYNGSSGTDHGVGTVALLAGGKVKGGKVFGDWPGLAIKDLYQGRDLQASVDLRSVFKGLLHEHLGVSTTVLNSTIFPESANVPALSGLVAEPKRMIVDNLIPKAPDTDPSINPVVTKTGTGSTKGSGSTPEAATPSDPETKPGMAGGTNTGAGTNNGSTTGASPKDGKTKGPTRVGDKSDTSKVTINTVVSKPPELPVNIKNPMPSTLQLTRRLLKQPFRGNMITVSKSPVVNKQSAFKVNSAVHANKMTFTAMELPTKDNIPDLATTPNTVAGMNEPVMKVQAPVIRVSTIRAFRRTGGGK